MAAVRVVAVAYFWVSAVEAFTSPCAPCDGFSFLSKASSQNPCGCHFVKVTPRRELTEMTNGQLEKKASGLQEEVDELQSTLEGYQKGNGEKIAKLKTTLKGRKEMKGKQASDEKAALSSRTTAMSDLKKEMADDQADITDVTDEMKTNQMMVANVRQSIALRMEDIHACGCKPEDKPKGAFVTKHVEPEEEPKVDYDLVFKVEKLERKKASLNKDITAEQAKFGEKSRDLMNRNDKEQININVVSNSNIKYKKLDEARLESVIQQAQNIKRALERKKAQLDQIEKDAAAAQKQYDNLEAEMKYCGCEPPSDTVLEMRKFALDAKK